MAPMINMVFFMCVSSLAQADRHFPVDLPESAESDVPDDLSDRGVISVQTDGALFLGAVSIGPESLASRIGEELKRRPDLESRSGRMGARRFHQFARCSGYALRSA